MTSNQTAARRRIIVVLFLKDHRVLKMLGKEQFDCSEQTIRRYLMSLTDRELQNAYMNQTIWLDKWYPSLEVAN